MRVAVAVLLLASGLLAACGSTSASPPPAIVPTTTTTATILVSVTMPASSTVASTGTRISAADAFDTRVAQTHSDIYTMVALSPPPVPGTRPPPFIPYPTATLTFGWVGCPFADHGGQPHFSNCWVGTIGGQLLWLRAGRYGHGGRGENIQNGLLDIMVLDAAQNMLRDDAYTPAQELGAIHMTRINGTLVTLEPDVQPTPAVSFVFDLTLHDWLLPAEIPHPLPPVGNDCRSCGSLACSPAPRLVNLPAFPCPALDNT